jgi:hypothetical protein
MDLTILWPFMVLAIPLIAVGRRPFEKWLDSRERIARAASEGGAARSADDAARIVRLESRVAVLERILTDRGTHLADEIERLRDRAN